MGWQGGIIGVLKGSRRMEENIILGVYFSGTGSTQHCVGTFVKQYDKDSIVLSIESPNVIEEISAHDTIVLGYPIYFSNVPKIVHDFINNNKNCFHNKKLYIIATMGLFSGDGTGCSARLLRKYSATILGGLHLKMPDCIGDEKALKKSIRENQKLILQAEKKIATAVSRLKKGNPHKEGLSFLYHMVGLFGQRLWFYGKTTTYKQKPNIDMEKCIGCGCCATLCPMKNISIQEGKAISHNQCTLCYRCFSHCPTQALTILGKQVYEQYLFEKYR